MLMTTDPGDLVLDPTCGSGTTAYVAEQWGRRWITMDTSRVAIALARTRLMAGATHITCWPIHRRHPERSRAQRAASALAICRETAGDDVKKGFVYKRVPHITLKSIANNEEIDAIHAKWQEQLEPLRAQINQADQARTGRNGKSAPAIHYQSEKERAETEKACDCGILPDSAVWKLLETWWNLRRERQKEIDASIARRADTELLYDQPYEDNKRIRVTGPFTVESLSPHRVLVHRRRAPDIGRSPANSNPVPGQFEAMIIENLRAAGVQNTVKNERLKFTRLEPYAGTWLHATGEYQRERTAAGCGQSVSRSHRPGTRHGRPGTDQRCRQRSRPGDWL